MGTDQNVSSTREAATKIWDNHIQHKHECINSMIEEYSNEGWIELVIVEGILHHMTNISKQSCKQTVFITLNRMSCDSLALYQQILSFQSCFHFLLYRKRNARWNYRDVLQECMISWKKLNQGLV